MKKDLRSLANGRPQAKRGDTGLPTDAERQLRQHEGKSEAQLMEELLQKVGAQRADGSFDEKELDRFVQRAGPLLTPEQKQKLRAIVAQIKRG